MTNERITDLIQKFIFFCGPTGMFFIPIPAVGSFRLFYVFCFLLIAVALFKLSRYILLRLSILFLIFITLYCSACYGMLGIASAVPRLASGGGIGLAGNPLVRVAVIGVLMISFFLIAYNWAKQKIASKVNDYLSLSYWGFVTVFGLGSVLYFGVVFGAVPSSVYAHFVTVEQTSFGYLRLSPGTYPNEFGVLCSFYAIFALMRYGETSKKYNVLFAFLFAAGILLTSTRAAYVTFAVGYLTILFMYPAWRVRVKYLIVPALGIPVILYGLSLISFNVISVIQIGYQAAVSGQGSVSQRTEGWQTALLYFYNHFWFGSGFESSEARFLHNLPLQLIAGLGAIGLLIVIVLFFIFGFIQKNNSYFIIYSKNNYNKRYLALVRVLLLEHVFLFGLTNHNQAHFLTWLLFAFLCLKIRTDEVKYAEYTFLGSGRPRQLPAPHAVAYNKLDL
jgi:hypothetical protein